MFSSFIVLDYKNKTTLKKIEIPSFQILYNKNE